MKKTRVLVLAGGQSGEHEVSINSARSVLSALPKDRFDVTSVVISHDMASVFRIADRIAMLHERQILVAGTVDEIRASQIPYLYEFIRTSGVAAAGAAS